jgi:mRNA interferase MazF
MVLAEAGRGDWILCQVTSNPYADTRAMMLSDESFQQGGLQRTSYARPAKLFTATQELMVAEVGILTVEARRRVITAVVDVLYSGLQV